MTANNSSLMILEKGIRIIGCLIAVAVLVELIFGLSLLSEARERRDTWNRGVATVSELEKVEATAETGATWRPIFTLAAEGKEYVIRSSSSSNPPAYTVGEKVEMLYPAENPEEAVTNNFMGLYLWPSVLLVMAGVEAVVALVLILISVYLRRRLRRLSA